MSVQNDRLNLQNNLIEADRRSSLVFLMSNVLDKVDEEIREQKDSPEFISEPEDVQFSLSEPLINRIVALSRAFRPYRMMEGDTLSEKLVSPERGQLFIALMENKLDSLTQNTIVERGDFSYAVIGEVDLRGAKLREANLLSAYLRSAYLGSAKLRSAYLGSADLRYADLSSTYLGSADLSSADLSSANFENAKNLTAVQLLSAKWLYNCKNLDPELEAQVRAKKPCLFTEDGCN